MRLEKKTLSTVGFLFFIHEAKTGVKNVAKMSRFWTSPRPSPLRQAQGRLRERVRSSARWSIRAIKAGMVLQIPNNTLSNRK